MQTCNGLNGGNALNGTHGRGAAEEVGLEFRVGDFGLAACGFRSIHLLEDDSAGRLRG
jgi:hypothetical protein